MNKRRKRSSTVGLLNGRMDWDNWLNRAVPFWAERRFSGKFIAQMTGLTVGQVYARCHKYGIRLLDTRDGEGANSEAIANNYSAGTITITRKRQIMNDYPNPDEE